MPQLFVNFAVNDLDASKAFYEALGFSINPMFSDHNAACIVVEDGHSYFMIHTREYFQTFTELPIGDPKISPTSSIAIFVESREAVDAAVEAGIAAGGTQPQEATDHGFMYQRGLADPSGNILDFGWMDPAAAAGGPDAASTPQG